MLHLKLYDLHICIFTKNNKSLEDIKRLVEETRRKHVTNKTFGDHRPHHEMHINRVLARQERISHLMHRNECYEAVLEICKDLPEVDQAQWFSEMQQTFWGMVNPSFFSCVFLYTSYFTNKNHTAPFASERMCLSTTCVGT